MRDAPSPPSPGFPFSAVLGQEHLKLALLLCAIDPAIGGVLVRGPRGVAKTTLARACAELLPGRFVELPLGASEERVTGSLDLGQALGQGQVKFAPGLLARAHGGVLYVDEVNLLPDALVDLLLDAAASGQNVVERDGVSQVHAARFVLIGTMNPEEGELRPQLCDRFGLSVCADPALTPALRTEVVLRRLEFERDPRAFASRFELEQRALRERCGVARERVPSLPFAGPGIAHAAELCHAAGVEGVRADLAMLRSARAHAAWQGRSELLVSDVDAVAELALAHRRRGPGPRGGGGSGGSSSGTPSGGGGAPSEPARSVSGAPSAPPGASAVRGVGGAPGAGGGEGAAAHPGSPASLGSQPPRDTSAAQGSSPDGASRVGAGSGALAPIAVRSSEPPRLPARLFALQAPAPPRQPSQRRVRGTQISGLGAIDWFATLARSPRPTFGDLRHRPRRLARAGTWVIALDCSASMLQRGALGVAKGVARAIAARAVRLRARVVLASFGGADVSIQPLSRSAPTALDTAIAALGAAGATPLRRAVELGLGLASGGPVGSAERRFVLLTDGRTRDDLTGLAARHPSVQTTLIDCERGSVRLSRARRIAEQLAARYFHVDDVASPAPSARW